MSKNGDTEPIESRMVTCLSEGMDRIQERFFCYPVVRVYRSVESKYRIDTVAIKLGFFWKYFRFHFAV